MRFLIIVISISFSLGLYGQSFFYNTQQYGLRSTLLGGAVTAGSADHSMIYYNPAALKYAQDKSLDLALLMPNYSSYNYSGYFGTDQNTQSRSFSLNPTLVTYSTDINDFDIVFTLLQKDSWGNEFDYSEETLIDNRIETESFSYRYRGDETWLGVGSSFEITPQFSLGLSQFWSILGTDYRYSIQKESLNEITRTQENFFSQAFDVGYSSTLSMVTKLGFALELNDQRFGLVVTTPRHNPINIGASLESSTIEVDQGQFDFVNQTDFNIQPEVKYGWEINLGYSKTLRDSTQIWANISYITGVAPYDLLALNDAAERSTAFEGGTEPVSNLSIGVSKQLSDRLEFMSSFRTNFTTYRNGAVDPNKQKIHVVENDRLHLAAGCKIDSPNSSIVIGLDWGFSFSQSDNLLQGFPNLNLLKTQDSRYSYNSLTLLMTYEFILDSVQKNVSKLFERNPDREQ